MVSGIDDLIKQLNKMPLDIMTKSLNQSVRKSAVEVKKEIQSRVPVDTGELRRTITIKKVAPSKLSPDYMVFKIGYSKANWYGKFFEFGTKYKGPQPILAPSLKAVEPKSLDIIKNSLVNIIKKFNKGK